MIYLASAYSHPDPCIRHARYLAVQKYAAHLIRTRENVFSPILHCHDLAINHILPYHVDYWWSYNQWFLDRVDILIVLTLKKWRLSVGLAREIAYAKQISLTTEYHREL